MKLHVSAGIGNQQEDGSVTTIRAATPKKDEAETRTPAKVEERVYDPANSKVRVSGLSAAGEQYIDFEPEASGGPYLSAGSVVTKDRATTPIPIATRQAPTTAAGIHVRRRQRAVSPVPFTE